MSPIGNMTDRDNAKLLQGGWAHWAGVWDRLDRSKVVAAFCVMGLICLGASCLLPLLDHYHDYVFEADSPTTISHVLAYFNFFRNGDATTFPGIGDYPPYFDGAFILYALGALFTRGHLALPCPSYLAQMPDQTAVIWTVRHINVGAYILACIPLFLSARCLCRRNSISTALTVVFLLSPPLLEMDPLRIDHVIVMALCWLVYLSLKVAEKRSNPFENVLLGAALAFLVNTKITNGAFALIPAAAMAWACFRRRYSAWNFTGFLVAGILVGGGLGFRFLIHIGQLHTILMGKIHNNRMWELYFPASPHFYYNWNYFIPYGYVFLALFFVALTGVCCRLFVRRRGATVVVIFCLMAFSGLLVPLMKYWRGGYVLIPFYLLVMAAGARQVILRSRLWKGVSWWSPAVTALLMTIALVPVLIHLLGSYNRVYADALHRAESVRITREEPRQWFKAHVPPGTRVAVVAWSQWCCPPVWDLGYKSVTHLFEYPLLYPDRLKHYAPPTFDEIEATCDIILFNSLSQWQFEDALTRHAPDNLARRWKPFFAELERRYSRVEFASRYVNYCICEVQMCVIHPGALKDAARAFRSDSRAGMTFVESRHSAEVGKAKPFAWFGDYDDSSAPLVRHAQLGEITLSDSVSNTNFLFFVKDINTWFWTSQSSFPFLQRMSDKTWFRYHRGCTAPRVLYNCTTKKEEIYP